MKREELERIEALNAARTQEPVRVGPLEGTTPEKWAQTVEEFAYISKAHGDADPQFWAVAIESPEQDGDVVTAMTGNGPTSKANAEFYAACHWAVPALFDHIAEQDAKIERLRDVLQRFVEITESAEQPPRRDPDYGYLVEELGDRIGYGALMASASASWRAKLAKKGVEGGESISGPCRLVLHEALEAARAALKEVQGG